MKKINSLLTALLLTASIFLTQQANAQAPQKMSYQSVLRNSSNALLVNTAVGIKISVLQGSESGAAVYVETQTATTNANGLVSLQIGTGTASTGSFATINWAAGPYFIKTETDPAGGTNYTITGTQEILSVPYAMYAKNGITTAQADAIVTMQAQITALQANLVIPTVTIGSQDWTKYNLNVTTYRNGDLIPYVSDPAAWQSLSTGAWCYINNDPSKGEVYGKLYNWYAINDTRGLAPQGWHIPSSDEWTILTDFLNGKSVAGGKMKGVGTAQWLSPNTGATNSSGFSAMPGGYRDGSNGMSFAIQYEGYWWSSSISTMGEPLSRSIRYDFNNVSDMNPYTGMRFGYSVRCIRD